MLASRVRSVDFQGVSTDSAIAGVLVLCILSLLLSAGTPGRPTARIGWGFLAASTAGLLLQSIVAWLPAGMVEGLGLIALFSAVPIYRSQRFDPILTIMSAGMGAVMMTLVALIFNFSYFHELVLFTAAAMAAVVAVMKLGETVLLSDSAPQVRLFRKWWNWVLAGLLVGVAGQAVLISQVGPSWLLWVDWAVFGIALSGGIQVVNGCFLLRPHRAFALACAEPSSTLRAFSRDFALCVAAPAVAFVAVCVSLSPSGIPAGLRAALLAAALFCLVSSGGLQWRMRSRVVGYDSARRHLMQQAMSTALVPLALGDPVYRLLPVFPVKE